MKSKTHYTALVAAGTLLLPLGAFAQSGTGTGSNTGASGQSQYQSSTSTAGMHGSAMQGTKAKRVSEDQLKEKVTAEQLRGKKVVDRDGKKIGKVKHVGLTQTLRQSDDNRSGASGSIGAGSMSASGSIGQSGVSTGSEQINLFVELDKAVGLEGEDLASIPVSSARFDKDKDELKLQIGRQELATQLRDDGKISSASE